MSAAKIKAEVRRFAREHGLTISPNPGSSPLIGRGDWFEVYDTWELAHKALRDAYVKHVDHDAPYPWQARSKNPVPPSSRAGKKSRVTVASKAVRQAASLYERFSGHEAERIGKIRVPAVPKVGVAIGEIDGVLYTTVRDGVVEKYIHKFKHSDKPLFVVSPDGRQLLMIGGRYRFTERGIVDTSDKK